jgi:hypothetical protein
MIIEFNENNFDEVRQAIKKIVKIKNRLIQVDKSLTIADSWDKKLDGSEKQEKIYNSIENLYYSNSQKLRDLYEAASGNKEYYVYAHCDPRKLLNIKNGPKDLFAATIGLKYKPIYIGKGKEDRAYDLKRNESHRKIRTEILKEGLDYEVIVLESNLTLGESLLRESKLIDIFGIQHLNSNSWLINLDEGKYSLERRRLYKKGSGKILLYNKYI